MSLLSLVGLAVGQTLCLWGQPWELTMLKIEQEGNQYKISVSNPGSGQRGYHVMAHSVDEIPLAIEHYFRPNTVGTERKQLHTNHEIENCPFCRLERKPK
jgi:hypothetical protein